MRIFLLLLTTGLSTSYLPQVRAAPQRPQFTMSCAQALKLGFDKFVDAYGEKTGDYSNAGHRDAVYRYTACRREANNRLARHLPLARRKQVDAARDGLQKLGDACWRMQEIRQGGGTMWGMFAAAAYGTREDYLATLVAGLSRPGLRDAAARRRIQWRHRSLEKIWAGLKAVPDVSLFADEAAGQAETYRRQWTEARQAAAQLKRLLAVLPDAAADSLSRRMYQDVTGTFEIA